MSRNASASNAPLCRIFLSHAGEDKETIARPLYKRLRNHGVSVFLDVESFHLGDHCPNVMVQAMQTAPVGVFIMSPEFIAKEWPMRELLEFVRRYDREMATNRTPPLLIPVLYRFSTHECRDLSIFHKYSNLFLEHGLIKRAADGFILIKDVVHALEIAAKLWSIESNSNADNSTRPEMLPNRESFVEMVLDKILERQATINGVGVNISGSLLAVIIIAFVICWSLTLVVLAVIPGVALGGYFKKQVLAAVDSRAKKDLARANTLATEAVNSRAACCHIN